MRDRFEPAFGAVWGVLSVVLVGGFAYYTELSRSGVAVDLDGVPVAVGDARSPMLPLVGLALYVASTTYLYLRIRRPRATVIAFSAPLLVVLVWAFVALPVASPSIDQPWRFGLLSAAVTFAAYSPVVPVLAVAAWVTALLPNATQVSTQSDRTD